MTDAGLGIFADLPDEPKKKKKDKNLGIFAELPDEPKKDKSLGIFADLPEETAVEERPAQEPAQPDVDLEAIGVAADPESTRTFQDDIDAFSTGLEKTRAFMGEVAEGRQRAIPSGASTFYGLMKGATRLAKREFALGQRIEEATGTTLPATTQLVKKGADVLARNFGGNQEGALETIEDGFNALEKSAAPPALEGQSVTSQVSQAIHEFPMELAQFVLGLELGGPGGVALLNMAETAEDEGATQQDITEAGIMGMAEGQFFKLMERFIPERPKMMTEKEVVAEQGEYRLNITDDPVQKGPSLLNPPERLYTEMIRETFPLEKVAKQLGDRELLNATRLMSGNAQRIEYFVNKGGIDAVTGKATGSKGLAEIQNMIPRKQQRAFNDYLVARHSRDMENLGIDSGQAVVTKTAGGVNRDTSLLDTVIAEGEGNQLFNSVAKELYRLQDDALKYLRDSDGVISDATYQVMRQKWPNYVPMAREIIPGFGEASSKVNPLKRLRGSGRTVINPFDSIVENLARAVNAGDRNRLINMLAKHEGKPGMENIIKLEGRKSVPVARTSLEEITESLSKVEKELGFIPRTAEEAGVGAEAFDEGISIWRAVADPKGRNVFEFKVNGESNFARVDMDLANVIGSYNLGAEEAFIDSFIVKTLAAPSVVLRAGAVTLNPLFTFKNLVRDQLILGAQSKTGAKPGIALMDGLMSYVKRDAAYDSFIRSGGSGATRVDMDVNTVARTIRQIAGRRNIPHWKEIGQIAMSPVRGLQNVTSAIENASRIGEFKAGLRNIDARGQTERGFLSLNRGGTVEGGLEKASRAQTEELGTLARDVTGDFSLKGKSRAAQNIRKIVTFSNANVQGLDRFIRLHRENPAKAITLGTLGFMLPSLLLHEQQMEDPIYRERYRRLPNWRKENFWNIDSRFMEDEEGNLPPGLEFAKGRMVPIPIPFEWGIVYKALPEAALSSYRLGDPDILKRAGETLFNSMNPLLQIDKGNVRPNLGPAIQPFVDINANRRSFFNAPIHTQKELDLPPQMRFDENTTRG